MPWSQNRYADNPLCVECAKRGRVTVATIRDHIIPLAEGGEDVPENTQPFKTKAESARGRGALLRGCDEDGVPVDRGHHWRKKG